jgi:hypothetical protein
MRNFGNRFSSLLKSEKLQSFVIEEIALHDLLLSAWSPIGKKLKGLLSSAINFKTGDIDIGKSLSLELSIYPEMFDPDIERQWELIANHARKYLRNAYRRAFKREPVLPGAIALVIPVSKEQETINNLLAVVKTGFLEYPGKTAVPFVLRALQALRELKIMQAKLATDNSRALEVIKSGQKDFGIKVLNFQEQRKAAVSFRAGSDQWHGAEDIKISLKNSLIDILGANNRDFHIHAQLAAARAYNFGFLDWAQGHNVTEYKISPVLDGKACSACLRTAGEVFSISDAQAFKAKFDKVAGDTALLKQETPFLTAWEASRRRELKESGVASPEDVLDAERPFFFPPFHPECRCFCVAFITDIQQDARTLAASESSSSDNLPDEQDDDIFKTKFKRYDNDRPVGEDYFNISAINFVQKFTSAEEALAFYEKNYNCFLNLKGMPKDMIVGTLNTIENLRDYFPNVMNKFKGIIYNIDGIPEKAYATMSLDGIMRLNPKLMSSIHKINNSFDLDVANSFHPMTFIEDGLTNIVTHEIGHHTDQWLFNHQPLHIKSSVKEFLNEVYTVFKSEEKKTSRYEFSEYAYTDRAEMFAEYFTHKTLGSIYNFPTGKVLDKFFQFLNGLPKIKGVGSFMEERALIESAKQQISDKQTELLNKLKSGLIQLRRK